MNKFTSFLFSKVGILMMSCSPGPRPQLPIEGPWRQASLKSFLKNVDAGKEETGKAAVQSSQN